MTRDPLEDIAYILVIHSSHGPLGNIRLFLDLNEVEFKTLALTVVETIWIQKVLTELQILPSVAPHQLLPLSIVIM